MAFRLEMARPASVLDERPSAHLNQLLRKALRVALGRLPYSGDALPYSGDALPYSGDALPYSGDALARLGEDVVLRWDDGAGLDPR